MVAEPCLQSAIIETRGRERRRASAALLLVIKPLVLCALPFFKVKYLSNLNSYMQLVLVALFMLSPVGN